MRDTLPTSSLSLGDVFVVLSVSGFGREFNSIRRVEVVKILKTKVKVRDGKGIEMDFKVTDGEVDLVKRVRDFGNPTELAQIDDPRLPAIRQSIARSNLLTRVGNEVKNHDTADLSKIRDLVEDYFEQYPETD